MRLNPANSHQFFWPVDGLLRLWDTIPIDEMRQPTILDKNGDPCIAVLKRSSTTNVTVGKVLRVIAYVRKHLTEHDTAVSKEFGGYLLGKGVQPVKEIRELS